MRVQVVADSLHTGEIYRMCFPGHTFIIACSYDMVNEFCDEKRFPKTIFALKVSTDGPFARSF